MSGIEQKEGHLRKIQDLLDREIHVDALTSLSKALEVDQPSDCSIIRSAICLDSCVFIRLVGHRSRSDILDYLDLRHQAPLIVSGQSVQEFWNNQLAGIQTLAASIKKKFDELKKDVERLDSEFGDYANKFTDLLSHFSSDYGYLYDEGTGRNIAALIDVLQRRSIFAQAPRMRFDAIARHRKRTKTPPGFKDDGDGDFFMWLDFLLGLSESRQEAFDRVVMVTDDKKIDWVRGGIPHPVLTAEVNELLGRPFEIWNLDRLAREVSTFVAIS